MNYRHIFHAGNISDIVKHAVLTLLLGHLREKEKPFCVLDTHAGIGRYDLQDPRAAKTNEAQDGILKLMAGIQLPELKDYYSAIRSINKDDIIRYYPGSPLLTAKMLRPQDRLVACELHKDDYHELRRLFQDNPQIHIHHRDAYEAIKAFVPPAEKRGLVLIDPPFEQANEFEQIIDAIKDAHKRWATGQFVIWYPVKERPTIWRFQESLAATGIPKQLCAEFIYREETRHDQLNGCGLLLINPPWQLDKKLEALFPALHKALETPHRGTNIKWLTPE